MSFPLLGRKRFAVSVLIGRKKRFQSILSKALLTLHVMTEMHFLLRKNLKNIMHGHVKMYVMRLLFCRTTFLFDLAPSCIDK